MILITVVVCISFVYFYSRNDFLDRPGGGPVATIYGRSVSSAQYVRTGRLFEVCRELALRNMFSGLPAELMNSLGGGRRDDAANLVWNSMVLRHEATELGLEPTEEEIVTATKALPAFQTRGEYDSEKYNGFIQSSVHPRGFSADDLGDLIGDGLRLQKIQNLLGATLAPSEGELRDALSQVFQKTESSVIRLKLDDSLATAQVSDEDVKKAFEDRKATLKTDETRKLKFVAFILPTTDTPLEPRARAEALGKLQKQAEDFAVAMTEKSAKIEDVATRLGAKVEETADFSRMQAPPEFGDSSDVATTAFKLTVEQPVGDIVSTPRGYYIIQLANIAPPRALTFEEAKGRLTEDLKHERATQALTAKATEIRAKIETELAAGKSFADAAQAAGAKAEVFPTFSFQEKQMEQENSGEIMDVASNLGVKQLSPIVPTATGSVLVYVENRPPVDEAKFKEERPRFTGFLANFQRSILFTEWLKVRRAASGLQSKLQN
jgi:hypothetical protein